MTLFQHKNYFPQPVLPGTICLTCNNKKLQGTAQAMVPITQLPLLLLTQKSSVHPSVPSLHPGFHPGYLIIFSHHTSLSLSCNEFSKSFQPQLGEVDYSRI